MIVGSIQSRLCSEAHLQSMDTSRAIVLHDTQVVYDPATYDHMSKSTESPRQHELTSVKSNSSPSSQDEGTDRIGTDIEEHEKTSLHTIFVWYDTKKPLVTSDLKYIYNRWTHQKAIIQEEFGIMWT